MRKKNKGATELMFKGRQGGSFYFHIEGRSSGGEVRGLSVVWTHANLAPVIETIFESFEAFPKKIIAQANVPDRKEIDDRDKQIAQLNEKLTERDGRIRNLTDRISELQRRVLSTDQVAEKVRLERDELNSRLAALLKERELEQRGWTEDRKGFQKRIDQLSAEITRLQSLPRAAAASHSLSASTPIRICRRGISPRPRMTRGQWRIPSRASVSM